MSTRYSFPKRLEMDLESLVLPRRHRRLAGCSFQEQHHQDPEQVWARLENLVLVLNPRQHLQYLSQVQIHRRLHRDVVRMISGRC